MLFHTWVFFVFFLIVYPGYLLVRKNNQLMNLLLMAASDDWFSKQVGLPIRISFRTLRSMSYTTDAYQRTIPTEPSFIPSLTFVSFLPQLAAGPIERAGTLLPQLQRTPRITRRDISD